jgi:ankyrin repeat protein
MRDDDFTSDKLIASDIDLQLPSVGVTQTGWTLLHLACWYGYSTAVQVLLDSGLKPETKDLSGKNARDIALMNEFQECADLLSVPKDDVTRSLFFQRNKQYLDDTQHSTEMTDRTLFKMVKVAKPTIQYMDIYEN